MTPARSWARQIAFAGSIGLITGGFTYFELMHDPENGLRDFTWLWRGAQELLAGRNPYRDPSLSRMNPYPADAPLFYPLPAVLAVLPLAWLSPLMAAAAFAAISTTVFVLGLRAALGPTGVLVFLSPGMLQGRSLLQWAPLFVGITLLWPRAAAIGLVKPNIGMALLAMRPSIRGPLIMAGVFAASVVVLPTWPLDWYRNLGQNAHAIPALAWPLGPLLGLAWLGRHLPEGRLLIALALVPQRFIFYDQLPLMLVARTGWQRLFLVSAGWMAYAGWLWQTGGEITALATDDLISPWIMAGCYLPAVALVLYHRFGGALKATWKTRLRGELSGGDTSCRPAT